MSDVASDSSPPSATTSKRQTGANGRPSPGLPPSATSLPEDPEQSPVRSL